MVVRTIGVGNRPDSISSDGTHVWVANENDNNVTELNASTGVVVQTIGVGTSPQGVSSDGTHVWVANNGDKTVTELNALTGAIVGTIGLGFNPVAISSDGTHVWVTDYGDQTVTELNASTGAVVGTIGLDFNPVAISSDGTHVWVTDYGDKTVTELNASTGAVVGTIGLGGGPWGISWMAPTSGWRTAATTMAVLDRHPALLKHHLRVAGQRASRLGPLQHLGQRLFGTARYPLLDHAVGVRGKRIDGALVSTGTCSIIATQAGNGDYLAATPVTQSFTVTSPCASGLSLHILKASYAQSSFSGYFCVDAHGFGTYTQGTVSGSGFGHHPQGNPPHRSLGQEPVVGGSDERHQERVLRGSASASDRDVHVKLDALLACDRPSALTGRLFAPGCQAPLRYPHARVSAWLRLLGRCCDLIRSV